MTRLTALLIGALLPFAWQGHAAAQTSPTERAAAEVLFDGGVKLMKQGKFQEGCVKLEESQKLDPAVGTLLYLAECYERVGRSASAWATFREAASTAKAAGQEGRARTGQERADRLEVGLSRLTIEVAPQTQAITGLVVTRGADPVPKALWGSALPVDPGEITVRAEAPGHKSWSGTVSVGRDADKKSVTVPALERLPESAIPAEEETSPESSVDATAATPREPVERSRTQRTLGFVASGAGLVGIGVGSVFGLRAMSKNDDAEKLCPSGRVCGSSRGVELTDQAKDAAQISNIAFAAGGTLLIGGIVLLLTEPKPAARTEVGYSLGYSNGLVEVRGRF